MWLINTFVCVSSLHVCHCIYSLKPLSYLQVPTRISNGILYYDGLNRHAAIGAAYDVNNSILYVIGRHLLHIVDLAEPKHPQLLFTKAFSNDDGKLKAIAICGDELVVAVEAKVSVEPGYVTFFQTHIAGDNITEFNSTLNSTVGPSPSSIKYTADCRKLVVLNGGEAGKDAFGIYRDPDGTLTIIDRATGAADRNVDFKQYNYGQAKYNAAVRAPSRYIPLTTLRRTTTLSQDAEPSHIALSPDGATAWITLPENNAIAEIDIGAGHVSDMVPIPLKDWSKSTVDTSDADGGVHRRLYQGLYSMRQPTVIKSFMMGGKTFLVTADEGAIKSYNNANHGFEWSDATLGKNVDIDNSKHELKANAGNDEHLGRLQVSRLDGKNFFNEQYSYLVAYGGRGFSIWDADDITTPVFDSEGSLEAHMEYAYKSVFNTDYNVAMETYDSPENLRDTVSDNMGAQVTSLDVKDDNGITFLVVGTSSTGTLYLYTMDTTGGRPTPVFQQVYREGQTDIPWRDMYMNATAGDLYIADVGIITSSDSPSHSPLVYVVSKGSGSVSIYQIQRT